MDSRHRELYFFKTFFWAAVGILMSGGAFADEGTPNPEGIQAGVQAATDALKGAIEQQIDKKLEAKKNAKIEAAQAVFDAQELSR